MLPLHHHARKYLRWDLNSQPLVFETNASAELGYASENGVKGIWTLTRSLQDFYAVSYIISPKNWCRRRDLHPHESSSHKVLALARLLIPPLRRIEKSNTDGEIRTHITLFLKQVPLSVGLRRRKKIWNLRFQIPNRILVWAAGFKPANSCSQGKPV